MHVYEAIASITASLSKVGIAKGRKTQQGGGASFAFRGIDDVLNALSPLLAEHKLCIFPRVTNRASVERQTKSGGALFYTTVNAEFDFVSAVDGSKHTAATIGEAMDSGDKATNKAMSAAYKYALLQTFAIPTEGDNDADATTHEVQPMTERLMNVLQELRDAALNGTDALRAAWQAASAADRRALADELPALKTAASAASGGGNA